MSRLVDDPRRARWPHDDPGLPLLRPSQGLVVVGCSRRKAVTDVPMPAIDLYQGGCIPQLRHRFAKRPALRSRVRIVSAAHGLLHPDDRIVTYDHRLTDLASARRLARRLTTPLAAELAASPGLVEVLVVAEPLYLAALEGLVDHPDLFTVSQVTDPRGWSEAACVLDRWGW